MQRDPLLKPSAPKEVCKHNKGSKVVITARESPRWSFLCLLRSSYTFFTRSVNLVSESS